MRFVCRFRVAATLALAGALASGCGEEGPALVPVVGVVTMGDKPLDNATISFVPDPGNKDVTPGLDVTGEDGTFKARYNGRSGLAVGKYKVLISKTAEPPPGVVIPKAFEADPFQQELMGVRKESLPKQYSDPAQSKEFVEVKEGKNLFDFDVKQSSKKAK